MAGSEIDTGGTNVRPRRAGPLFLRLVTVLFVAVFAMRNALAPDAVISHA
jgi:hypothetical protein